MANFAAFDPHADLHDPQHYPLSALGVHGADDVDDLDVRRVRAALPCCGSSAGWSTCYRARASQGPGARPEGLRALRADAPPRARRAAAVVPGAGHDGPAAEVQRVCLGQGPGGLPWAGSIRPSFWHRVFALVTFTCFGIYMIRACAAVPRRPPQRGQSWPARRFSGPIRPCPTCAT